MCRGGALFRREAPVGRNQFHFHLAGLEVTVKGPSGQAVRQWGPREWGLSWR